MNFPEELKYTTDHEWVRIEGTLATVGITDFAQSELGDIVYVDIDKHGETVKQAEVLGSVEAVKTVSDIFMPLSGKVVEVNNDLEKAPDQVNKDPYNKGWMVKIELSEKDSELPGLMDATAYKKMIGL